MDILTFTALSDRMLKIELEERAEALETMMLAVNAGFSGDTKAAEKATAEWRKLAGSKNAPKPKGLADLKRDMGALGLS